VGAESEGGVTAPAQLLSFDPAKTSGWAWFSNAQLVRAGYGPFHKLIAEPPTDLIWFADVADQKTLVLIETPHDLWKGEVDDIIKVAIMVGRLEEFYAKRGCEVVRVKPVEWKGSVPGDVMTDRILNRLRPEELARVPLRPRAKTPDHNCVDAIGLGLWKLGRMHGTWQ